MGEAYDQPKHGGCIMKRVAIYLRVSTSKQDTDNQRRELEAVAARSGWHIERFTRMPASVAPRAGTSALGSTPCSRR